VRFLLTPEIQKTVKPHAGRAIADFSVPASLGSTTAYAELEEGRYQLSVPVDASPPSPGQEPPSPPRKLGKTKIQAKPLRHKRPAMKR
jgi:hypothetical protein